MKPEGDAARRDDRTAGLTRGIKNRDERIRRQSTEIDTLRARLESETQAREAMLQSRSWKIVAPARTLAGLLKRVLGDLRGELLFARARSLSGARQIARRCLRAVRSFRLSRLLAPSFSRTSFVVRRLRRVTGAEPGDSRAGTHDHAPGTVVYVTHVVPYPPRAGNEYRIHRMLRWLEQQGCRVIVVVSPLVEEDVTEEHVRRCREAYPNLIVCYNSGRLLYQMDRHEDVLDALARSPIEATGSNEGIGDVSDRQRYLLSVERTFCPDALATLMSHLQARLPPFAVITSYVFMTRFLATMNGALVKIVDTIDVFSTKDEKVVQFGIEDSLSLTREEERERLLRADVAMAIQEDERRELAAIVPERVVITTGVDYDTMPEDVSEPPPPDGDKVILFVGSDNAMNVKGLRDFLSFAWTWIRRDVPDARVVVVGRVCDVVRYEDSRVSFLGPVDELAELFRSARVVINPAVAGTGLKVKTPQALCCWRPIVTWPAGTEGLDEELEGLCLIAEDWYDFYLKTVGVLNDSRSDWFSPPEREVIKRRLSPDTVYAELWETMAAAFSPGSSRNEALRPGLAPGK